MLALAFASVFELFSSRCPTAIARRISFVVVDAINAVIGRSLTHVGKKVLEFVPAFTNRDTAPTVILECKVVRISASVVHTEPRYICGAVSGLLVCVAVFVIIPLGAKAATAAGTTVAGLQVSDLNICACAASTLTKPKSLSSNAVGYTNSGQTSVLLTCDINDLGQSSLPQGCWSSGGRTLQGSVAA